MKVRHVARTNVGRKRDHNEDTIGEPAAFPERAARGDLFAVADGLGGHEGGEIASRIAIEALFKTYYASDQEEDQALAAAVLDAGARIVAAGDAQIHEAGDSPAAVTRRMGSTLVAAVVQHDRLFGVNVGDSRAYLLHDGKLERLTHDHSLVGEEIRRGRLSDRSPVRFAAAHPRREHTSY